MRKHLMILAAILASLAVVAAGCGGGDNNDSSSSGSSSSGSGGSNADTTESTSSGGGGGGAQKLTLTADAGGALKFNTKSLSAKAGKVTITMNNPSSVPHAVEVEGNGVEKETKTLTQGKASLTTNLKPGKYEFYCPVDGHRAAGMEGTLTVG